MQKITMKTLDDLDQILKVCRLVFETKGELDICIKEHKIDRSAEQNALYWRWLTEIANHVGESKERMHEVYKEMFLLTIFVRDDPEYAEMAKAIKAIKAESPAEYAAIRKQVIAMTSTTKCSVKQMTEYLNNIKLQAATSLGFNVSLPEMKGLI